MKKLPVAHRKQLLAGLRRLLWRYRRQMGIVLVLQAVASASIALLPWITGEVVDRVQNGEGASAIFTLIWVAFAAVIVGAGFTYGAEKLSRSLSETVFADLREEMMETIVHLPQSVVEEAGTGDLLGRTTRDLSELEYVVRKGLSDVLALLTTIVVTVVFAVASSPLISVVLLVPLPLMWLLLRWYLPRTVSAYQANASVWAVLAGNIAETVEQIDTVDSGRLTGIRIAKLDEIIRRVWRLERYTSWMRLWLWAGMITFALLPTGLAILVGAGLQSVGLVTIGQITTVALYCYQLREPIWSLTFWMDQMQAAAAAFARVVGVGLTPPDESGGEAVPVGAALDVEDLHYSYTPDKPILKGVDLNIAAGETIAMVGPSGAGKSTLARMIAGVHLPRQGSVRVGGAEVGEIDRQELPGHVALVTQEHHVFSGTVADNLRLADTAATDAELQYALDAVHWTSPVGLHERIGAGGIELDPGEAQQLALARIVLLKPSVVILDEATSLMGPRGDGLPEALVQDATVISVTHRLHVAPLVDRVVVVVDGIVDEVGPHDELLARKGDYAELWSTAMA